MKDTHEHKNHKKAVIGFLALGLTLVLGLALFLSLYPAGSGGRYVESEVYEGTEIYGGTEHGDHSGWVDLNATYSGTTAEGVTWTTSSGYDTCTISSGGSYYLSADLTADIVVLPPENPDYDSTDSTSNKYESMDGEVIFCLNGYCLTCAADNTSAVTIGEAGSSSAAASDVVFSLYDCGGGKGVYYYKYNTRGGIQGSSSSSKEITTGSVVYTGTTFEDWDGETDAEVFHTGYDFSDSNLTAETCDGYVRGGLITGAVFTKGTISKNYRYNGGGVTVGPGCTFRMYGGTIAGNHVMSGTYNDYIAAGVLVFDSTFDMYGGMIAGNCCGCFSTSYPSGSGVGLYGKNADVTMNMYGGEIKENYKHSGGAGICGYLMASPTVTVNMYGGTVSENVSDGQGGGIMLSSNSSSYHVEFHMYGGTVRDNVTGGNNSRNGGGVAIGGVCEMTGGAIYGNRALNASGLGGGVYYSGGTSDTLTLGGEVYIYGNHAGGKISNLDLYSGTGARYITLSSALEEGARVGVTVYSPKDSTRLTVTGSDTTTYQYIAASMQYIISDDRSYGVRMNGGGTSTSSYLELYSLTG